MTEPVGKVGDAKGGERARPAARPGERARPAARPGRPSPGWVFTAALGAFLIALALLAVQVRAGRDPAIGARPEANPTAEPRRILVRRVVRTTVVTHVTPGTAPPPTTSVATAPAAPAAPALAAPAPAAPAPAPVTTRAS
jgi:hypothetical protein